MRYVNVQRLTKLGLLATLLVILFMLIVWNDKEKSHFYKVCYFQSIYALKHEITENFLDHLCTA